MIILTVGDTDDPVDLDETELKRLPSEIRTYFDSIIDGLILHDRHMTIRVYTDTLPNHIGGLIDEGYISHALAKIICDGKEYFYDQDGVIVGEDWLWGIFY